MVRIKIHLECHSHVNLDAESELIVSRILILVVTIIKFIDRNVIIQLLISDLIIYRQQNLKKKQMCSNEVSCITFQCLFHSHRSIDDIACSIVSSYANKENLEVI